MNTRRSNKSSSGIMSEIVNKKKSSAWACWVCTLKFGERSWWCILSCLPRVSAEKAAPWSTGSDPVQEPLSESFIASPFYPISKPHRQSHREWHLLNSLVWPCNLFLKSISPKTGPDTYFVRPDTKRKILNYQELQESKTRTLPKHRTPSRELPFPCPFPLLAEVLSSFQSN